MKLKQAFVYELFKQYSRGEISFGRFVELLNEEIENTKTIKMKLKEKLLGLVIIAEIIALVLILNSCNPCKNIAKYERCFPSDTIKLTEYKTKYVNQWTVKDSIIKEVVPCDPLKPETIKETIYKTNWRTTIDTIYTDKQVDRINPINEVLKKDNDELVRINKIKNKALWIESILLLIIGLLVYIKKRL